MILSGAAYGQSSESEKYNHGCQPAVNADSLDLDGEAVPDERVAEIVNKLRFRKSMLGIKPNSVIRDLFHSIF